MPTIRWRILRIVAVVVVVALGIVCASVSAALAGYELAFRMRMPPPIAAEFAALEARGLDDGERGVQIYVAHRPDVPEIGVLLGALAFGTLAALLVAVPLARRMSVSIGGRLDELAVAARRVAGGAFEVRVAAPADVSDVLDRLQRDFNDMADALARMEQSQRLESAALAHELRTPLGALRAQVDALVDGVVAYTPDRGRLMQTHVLTLSRLVEDLRALSLAQIGQLQMELGDHALEAVLQSTLDAWAESATSPVLRAGDASGWAVRVDPMRFRQVLYNLLQNAHRHGAPPFVLGVSAADGLATISLRDHGPGLATSEARRSAGDGLGLRVVSRLCGALGITFAIGDAPDGGVVASLALPAHPAARKLG